MKYEIKPAKKVNKAQLNDALGIYLHSVDDESDTNANEIRDYIRNKYTETRIMFFYVLFLNDQVVGFAEFGYLNINQTLVIDYISTEPRNHTMFYNYYHMLIEDITNELMKKEIFIKYIIAELSLKEENKLLIDKDSNYFRQLLSLEDFRLLKLPYYQPSLRLNIEKSYKEFNIAIKPLVANSNGFFSIGKAAYMSMIRELLYDHYLSWYMHYYAEEKILPHIDSIYEKIENEYPENLKTENISLVNCSVFEQGKCKQITSEMITFTKIKHKRRITHLKWGCWMLFSIVTFVLCAIPPMYGFIVTLCSFFTIIAGVITIFSKKQS